MTATIKALSDGLSGELQVGGSPALRFGADTSGQMPGFRNKIINGKMEIAQRGTSFAAIVSGSYSLDRWKCISMSAAVVTASQQTDVPSSNEFYNSLRATITTADTSIAAGDLFAVEQIIEGSNVRNLIGNTFTLSFWVRSAKTGIHCVAFRNNGQDRSYVAEYTVNVANTWEKKTILVSGGLITAGTWDWTNGVGLRADFVLASGSTFQTTAGAWQTGNFIATSNQVNCLDTAGNIFAITGVQLEAGSIATPFEHRPYGTELALCQRYFQRLVASETYSVATGMSTGANNPWYPYHFPTVMRAAPTCTFLGTAADYWVQWSAGTSTPTSIPTWSSTSGKGGYIQIPGSYGMSAGTATIFLLNNSSGAGGMLWSAEL